MLTGRMTFSGLLDIHNLLNCLHFINEVGNLGCGIEDWHSLGIPSDVPQNLMLFLDQLHLFHGRLSGDCSEVTLFGCHLISIKGLLTSGVANLMTWCNVEATPFILCNQSRPTIALYREGISTTTNSVTSSWEPTRILRVTVPKD